MDLSGLGKLGDLAKQMQSAYSDGLSAMNQAGEMATKDMNPDHEIELNIKLNASIEGHEYKVDSEITFEIELEPILQTKDSPMGDLSSLLDGLGVDIGEDKDAVMEQLGQPRAIGRVKNIKTKTLEISNKSGKVKTELNKKATLLATLKDGKLHINCEGVFTYPENTDVFVAIPSMEKMQKNIVFDTENLSKEIEFKWEEKDKDNLTIEGKGKIKKI